MIDFLSLVKSTNAYKIITSDKKERRLSHAYLVICHDEVYLKEYVKTFAKIIACDKLEPCLTCRTCKLIDSENHLDVMFFPKGEKGVTSDDVVTIIDETFIRPVENDKKIFCITSTDSLSQIVQNKLLKTLEEPPKGVHIVLGVCSEYSILPTLLSRMRKLEIPAFSNEALYSALSDEGEKSDVISAVNSSDGSVGSAVSLMGDKNLAQTTDVVCDVLNNMKTSKDVLSFSVKISALKGGLGQFLSVLDLALSDVMRFLINGEKSVVNKELFNRIKNTDFNEGSCIYALEKIQEAFKKKNFNANSTMLVEWLLFQILEGKYKWRK